MTALQNLQIKQGAILAQDGIPLHFGNLVAEYRAGLDGAVLMDRSHEGRLIVTGKDRIEIIQRICTNDLSNMAIGEGRGTVFTNPNARIIDRVEVYNRNDAAHIITEPGRNAAVHQYLQRNIFFNDDAQVADVTPQTKQFVLHGIHTDSIIEKLGINPLDITDRHGIEAIIGDVSVFVARRKSISGNHWSIHTVEDQKVAILWENISAVEHLTLAGSLTFNSLRIRSGRPAAGRELSRNFLPLEVGLWDEVSFSKGCYTGQEIIARMESRNRLAKTIVRVQLSEETSSPVVLLYEGKTVGTLTSSVRTATNELLGIGIVKTEFSKPDIRLISESGVAVTVIDRAGAQPPASMLN